MTLADELERLGQMATKGQWFDDNLRVDGSNGRDDYYTALYGPSGHILADTLNSTCVHLEDNGEGRSLDTTGAANIGLIIALRNNLPAIIAALRAQEWQPIESIPDEYVNTGKHFLAYEATGDMYSAAYHSDGYIVSFCGQYVSVPPEPTHWMPLPAPPATDKGEHKP
jgi:hypothetical protein